MAESAEPQVIPEEKTLSSNVCEVCLSDNLLKQIGIRSCPRCNQAFCVHFASKIDPQYCVDCMSEVSVTVNNISKVYEHYNEITETITKYSRRARQIKIEGSDWLFAQRKIKELSEIELAMVIEYHRTYFQLLLVEDADRKTAKMHRFAGVKIQGTSSVSASVTTTVTKSTQTKSTKAAAQLSSLLSSMLAKGLKPADIAAMLKGKP